MPENNIHPVILCGGSGARLWPISRQSYPKQFLPLLPGGSSFQQTLTRLNGQGFAPPWLMTAMDYRFIVGEQAAQTHLEPTAIVLEPEARNTAPAICSAALMIAARDPEALLLVLPSDHVIEDEAAFWAAVAAGTKTAADGQVVVFGVQPDRAEAAYGCIELTGDPGAGPTPFARFLEKPGADAKEMALSGRHLWSSGAFLAHAKIILTLFENHAPDVFVACRRAVADVQQDLDFLRLDTAYNDSPAVSFDHAIMEKITGTAVPVDCGWSSFATWETVWQHTQHDTSGNVVSDRAKAIACEDTLLRAESPDQRVVGLGLTNIVAVATRDAVLVADRRHTQDVHLAIEALKAEGATQAIDFPRCYRPWGWYETLALGTRFQVKRIMVKPGGLLSLQSHVHRSEHWIVVTGTARVTVGEEVRLMTENESVYIPLGAIHRLENPGKVEMHLIEVQSGIYLGEDDIVRYEDVYARA